MKNPTTFIFFLLFFLSADTEFCFSDISLSGNIIHDSRVLTDKGVAEESQSGSFIKSVSYLKLKLNRYDEDNFSLHGQVWATDNHSGNYGIEKDTNDGEDDADVFLREAYINGKFGKFEFNIGKMILNWGRTDYINAVDIINPENFSEFYTVEMMDIKMPVMLFNGRLFYRHFTFDTVFIPFFENSIIPTAGDWVPKEIRQIHEMIPNESFDIDFDFKRDREYFNIENSEIAFRMTGVTDFMDYGLVYFNGYNDIGALKFTLGELNQILFESVYHRYNGYGCDFTFMIKGYGIRGEIFFRDEVPQSYLSELGILNTKITSDFQSIIGVDKFYGDNFYINCQFIFIKINDYSPDMIAEETENIITLLIEKKFYYEQLKVASRIFYGLEESDVVLNPFCEYLMTDNLKAELGSYIFSGPKTTFLGQFDPNDHCYVRINYAF